MHHAQSYSLTGFTLQTSPQIPIDGESWGTYYDDTNNEIFLLNPTQCSSDVCVTNNFTVKYDIITNVFTTDVSTPLVPSPVLYHGSSQWALSFGDSVYFNGIPRYFASYDIHSRDWEYMFQDTGQYEFACVTSSHDRFIYILGGTCCQETSSNFGKKYTKAYDVQNGVWQQGIDMLYRRSRSNCHTHNGLIYLIGGINVDTNPFDTIHTLNIGFVEDDVLNNFATKQWEELSDPKLNIARYSASSVMCTRIDTDLFYIIGGRNDEGWLDSIEVFDLNANTIELLPFGLNEPRSAPAVVCINEYIYVMGGSVNGNTVKSWEMSNVLFTAEPTADPTENPTHLPSKATRFPSKATQDPTLPPTIDPTERPTANPTLHPITSLTEKPEVRTTELNEGAVNEEPLVSTTGSDDVEPEIEMKSVIGNYFVYIIVSVIGILCLLVIGALKMLCGVVPEKHLKTEKKTEKIHDVTLTKADQNRHVDHVLHKVNSLSSPAPSVVPVSVNGVVFESMLGSLETVNNVLMDDVIEDMNVNCITPGSTNDGIGFNEDNEAEGVDIYNDDLDVMRGIETLGEATTDINVGTFVEDAAMDEVVMGDDEIMDNCTTTGQ